MKKILILGDIHGRGNWEDVPNLTKYDQIVVMGDYFDPYGGKTSYGEAWKNFQDLLELQNTLPVGKVILLFGNHDQHYLDECYAGSRGSRWDPNMLRLYNLNEVFHELLDKSKLKLAYHIPGTDILCIHAGISIYWYNHALLGKPWDVAETEPVISDKPHDSDAVGKLAQEINQYPYIGGLGFQSVSWDTYGYDRHQGPLWWRCLQDYGEGLQEDQMLRGFTQVMGHT